MNIKQSITNGFIVSLIFVATEIKGIGEIVCSKNWKGYHYGITFFTQASVEDLIINELKARRRKEILIEGGVYMLKFHGNSSDS